MAIGPINPARSAAVPPPVAPVAEPNAVQAVLNRLAALGRAAAAEPPGPSPETSQAQAVARAVQAAAPRQGGLAPLLADLAEALTAPGVPPQVRDAAVRILGLRTPLSPSLNAADLRTATARSGLFLEAEMAARPPPPGAAPLDLKAALLTARQALRDWLARAPAAQSSAAAPTPPLGRTEAERPPPPFRAGPLVGQPPAAPAPLATAEPLAIAQRLLRETDAAVARQELMQAASLPAAHAPDANSPTRAGHWMFEIPFATPQGSAVAQFEIDRDGGGGAEAAAPAWRARFAVDVEPFGPVQAEVSLSAGRAGVRLWAERQETVRQLRARQDLLLGALEAAAYVPEVAVYAGAPPRPAAPAGHFLDRSS